MDSELYRRVMAGETLTHVLSPRALWRMTGPDRVRYLNGQVTNDVAKLEGGHACHAAICTAKGRMEGDVHIAAHGEAFYLDAGADQREALGLRLDKYLIADDALLEDISDEWSLSHVFGKTAPPAPSAGFVIAHARFGVPGFDVWQEGGNPVVIGDAVPADVIDTLCLEFAIPRWGSELSPNTLPPEAGPRMLDAISYTKGCYVGQETIARLKSVGHVNRTLVLLQSVSDAFPAPGAKLVFNGLDVGVVTSSGYSPRLGKGAALGYVQIKASDNGASLTADGLGLAVINPPSLSVNS